MPKVTRPGWVPKYRRHKRSGLAYVSVGGRDLYLGAFGSDQSKAEYDRVIAEWLASARPTHAHKPQADHDPVTVTDLIAAFRRHAEPIYSPTSLSTSRSAYRPLRKLYGHTRISDFTPLALKALQRHLADQVHEKTKGRVYCRKTINDYTARIRHLFKWGVGEGLVPAAVWQALLAVPGLRYGRTTARENDPVGPVPDAHVEVVLPLLPPTVADMVRLQRLTGARPGEICAISAGEIDTSGAVWMYTPRHHKTAHHGKRRTVAIGPRAQAVLRRYLTPDLQAPLFSPARSEQERARRLREERTTPLTPSQRRRDARHAADPRADYRLAYLPAAYARAIRRACRRAGIPAWSPNQLRHSRATEIRKTHGLDAAGAVLGHTKRDDTGVRGAIH